ncbi:MAG: oligoendopeptidase F family protein [Clostridia bacterium]|nr:oligoendopeptidase F family protein [Clostridia bacterium]
MKKRNQIDNKFKWDLELFSTSDEIEKVFSKMEMLAKILPSYKGKLTDIDILHEYLTKFIADEIEIEKLAFYISNSLSVDKSNVEFLKLEQRFDRLYSKIGQAEAFFMPECLDFSDKYINKLENDKRFDEFKNFINKIKKQKPHRIDENSNLLLSKMSNFLGNNHTIHSIITNTEMEYEDAIDSKGNKKKIDQGNIFSCLQSSDPKLRETAFNSRMKAYSKHNKTFAELYLKDIEQDSFMTKLKNYPTLLDNVLESADVPKSVFDNVIKSVNENIPLLQEYVRHQGKVKNNKQFAYYDLFEDEKVGGKVDVEKAKSILIDSLKIMGSDYINKVSKKLNDKSIDYMPNKDKRSGAYCSDTYDAKTVILMNFTNDFNSINTLAHEMGHCINAEYYNENQSYQNAGITIFAAEIASTVNEILLNQYMLSHCKENEKSYYLHDFLDGVRSTIYRQTLFSEFELYAHEMVESEQPITYLELNQKYEELNKKYYGNSCKLPKLFKYEWSYIPHFYRPYYVYSYATGMITAITIANRIINEKGFTEKYIKFLSNGTNRPAVEILKEIGIDLTTRTPFDEAFDFIKQQLKLYKKVTK